MADRTIPLYPRNILKTGSNFFATLITATAGILTTILTVTGNETVTSSSTNNGDLTVCGDVMINGDIYINGSITVAGSTITPMPSGSIMPFAVAGVPSAEWLQCDGASYQTSMYPDLFNAIGYTFGGIGANFNVPDLRGRVAVGQDLGAGVLTSSNVLGNTGGSETHSVIEAELPTHIHVSSTTPGDGSHTHPFNGSSTTMAGEGSHTNTATGGGGEHNHNLNYTNVTGRDMAGAGETWNFVTTIFNNFFYTGQMYFGGGGGPFPTGGHVSAGGAHSHSFTIPPTVSSADTGHVHNPNIISYAGASTPHSNVQPYLVLNYVIKT